MISSAFPFGKGFLSFFLRYPTILALIRKLLVRT